MSTPKQLKEERALEKTVRQAESIAGAIIAQDKTDEKCNVIPSDNQLALEPNNVSQIFGACRFCGQARSVSNCKTEDEANEYATLQCNCMDARVYQDGIEAAERRAEALQEVSDNLKNLFGNVKPETMMLMNLAAEAIYDRKLVSQSLKLSYTVSAKISRSSKGNISIERKDATAQKIEV